jgi:hypothetical protein
MADSQQEAIDEEIAKLEAARAAREALINDPEYQRIRKLYQNLADALDALDEAGERIGDEEGYALYIHGKSFIVGSRGVTENAERWRRYMAVKNREAKRNG